MHVTKQEANEDGTLTLTLNVHGRNGCGTPMTIHT